MTHEVKTETKYGEYTNFKVLQFWKFEIREIEIGYATIYLLLCQIMFEIPCLHFGLISLLLLSVVCQFY